MEGGSLGGVVLVEEGLQRPQELQAVLRPAEMVIGLLLLKILVWLSSFLKLADQHPRLLHGHALVDDAVGDEDRCPELRRVEAW